MKEFTIVIATAIRPTLTFLLENIDKSTMLPKEVIISIPKGKKLPSSHSKYSFKTYVISKGIGQVNQRIEGFKLVRTSLCIQMDDDLSFNKTFLQEFLTTYNNLPINSALAPSFFLNNKPNSVLISPKPPISALLYFILDGKFKPNYGNISKAGLPFGINPNYKKKENSLVETSWIPGACVVHLTKNLQINWEYPKEGKAYAEDIIHSQLLKKKNIKLFVERSLIVNLDVYPKIKTLNIKNYIFSRVPLFKILKTIPGLKTSFLRYYVFSITYFFIKSIEYLIKKLIN